MDGGGLTAASQQTQQQGQQEDGPQHQQDSRLVALSKEMAQRLRHDPPDGERAATAAARLPLRERRTQALCPAVS